MSQRVLHLTPFQRWTELSLPPSDETLLGRISWGHFSQPFTPAFWRASLWLKGNEPVRFTIRAQASVRRETVFCLLGGYGIKAEVAQAYFRKLTAAGVFSGRQTSEAMLRQLLKTPATFRRKTYGYRFPNQKARYLAQALVAFASGKIPRDDLGLRDWLLQLPGIGQKTAAWIVRNCLGSDNVAIIDIHLQRAGRLMGLFDARALTDKTYSYFEERFLAFARAMKVQPSSLDMLIWETMRQHVVAPRLLFT